MAAWLLAGEITGTGVRSGLAPGQSIPGGICPDGDEEHVAGELAHPLPDLTEVEPQVRAARP